MLIDTHTHLYLEEFADGEGAAAVRRALDAGVGKMIFPNVDRSTVEPMQALHSLFPDCTYMAIGLHPTEVDGSDPESQLSFLTDALIGTDRFVAIGEIGIDLYWDKTFREQQMQVFERQMQLAASLGLPAIIHGREGLDEILEVIDGLPAIPQAVFHSFGGSEADVERIRRRGDFYFGINGIVTFKNSSLRNVLPSIGIDRLLLETDSPYLTPVPHRGRRNESAYIIHTAAHVAASLGITTDVLASSTTASACRLFAL